MKKFFITAAFLVFVVCGFAQMSEIRGVMKTTTRKEINLFKVVDGHLELFSSTSLGPNGEFGFLFAPPYEGFYALGYTDNRPSAAQYPVYLKENDKTQVEITGKRIKYTGKQTPENTVLAAWNKLTEELKIKALYFADTPLSNFRDFYPLFEKTLPKIAAFKNTINTPNAKFNKLMKDITYFDMDYYAITQKMTPRTEHPKEEDLMPYYKTIGKDKSRYLDDNVLSSIYGERMIYRLVTFTKTKKDVTVEQDFKYLNTDRQKGVYAFMRVSPFIKSFDQYDNVTERYKKYFESSPTLMETVKEFGKQIYNSKSGGQGLNFTYPDQNGKMVSFSDLKGKLVLIDVWATWCGPCKQEIPYLDTLEHELKDKDITFVSLSVDEKTNEQKWKDMIKEKNMGGIQLFAGSFTNKVNDMYNISSIPRFMLFDRKGKIISLYAPRPSNPDLKKMILEELDKK